MLRPGTSLIESNEPKSHVLLKEAGPPQYQSSKICMAPLHPAVTGDNICHAAAELVGYVPAHTPCWALQHPVMSKWQCRQLESL